MTETINLIVPAVWCDAGGSVLNGALIERVVARSAEWRAEWKCLCHLRLNQLFGRLLHQIAYREDLFIINDRQLVNG